MEGKKACRIESRIQADFFDRARWNSTIEEITDRMVQLEKIFSPSLTEVLPEDYTFQPISNEKC